MFSSTENGFTFLYDRLTNRGTYEGVATINIERNISGTFYFDSNLVSVESIAISPKLTDPNAIAFATNSIRAEISSINPQSIKEDAKPVKFHHKWIYETPTSEGEIEKLETSNGVYNVNAVLRILESGQTYFLSLNRQNLLSCHDLKTITELPSISSANSLCTSINEITGDITAEAKKRAESALIDFVSKNFPQL